MINKTSRIMALIVLVLWFLVFTMKATAQNVVLKNRTFIQQSVQKDSVNTGYEYQDKNGDKHTVYLSGAGKAYCWMKSKQGKIYKRYLPKITEELKKYKLCQKKN
jgi:hypothetical protein